MKKIQNKQSVLLGILITMATVFAIILGVCLFGEKEEQSAVGNQVETVTESPKETEAVVQENIEATPLPEVSSTPTATVATSATPQITATAEENENPTISPGQTIQPGTTAIPGSAPTQGATTAEPVSQSVVTVPTKKPIVHATKKPAASTVSPTKRPTTTKPSTNHTEAVPTKKPTEPVKTPEASGVSFTIDTSVIGNGQYVSNKSMELNNGENVAAVIVKGLREAGFSYESTGTIANNFYLSRIKKSGMVKSPSVSDRIKDILDDNGAKLNLTNYESGSLGEFDFTKYSGWRYSVNGTYAGVGMSDYKLKAGDHVVVKYTLCLGYDM